MKRAIWLLIVGALLLHPSLVGANETPAGVRLAPDQTQHLIADIPLSSILMAPIAEMPFEEARAILERHRDAIMGDSRIYCVRLGTTDIHVCTNEPDILPAQTDNNP